MGKEFKLTVNEQNIIAGYMSLAGEGGSSHFADLDGRRLVKHFEGVYSTKQISTFLTNLAKKGVFSHETLHEGPGCQGYSLYFFTSEFDEYREENPQSAFLSEACLEFMTENYLAEEWLVERPIGGEHGEEEEDHIIPLLKERVKKDEVVIARLENRVKKDRASVVAYNAELKVVKGERELAAQRVGLLSRDLKTAQSSAQDLLEEKNDLEEFKEAALKENKELYDENGGLRASLKTEEDLVRAQGSELVQLKKDFAAAADNAAREMERREKALKTELTIARNLLKQINEISGRPLVPRGPSL